MSTKIQTLDLIHPLKKKIVLDESFKRATLFLSIGTLIFLGILYIKGHILASKFLFLWLSGGCCLYCLIDFSTSLYILSFTIPLEQAITNWGGGRFNSLSYLLMFLFIFFVFKAKNRNIYIRFSKLEIVFLIWIVFCASTMLWSNNKLIGIGNILYSIGGFLIIFIFKRELKNEIKLLNSIMFYIAGVTVMTVALYTTYRPGSAMIKKASGEWINNAFGLGTGIDPNQYARGAIVGLILSLFLFEVFKKNKIKLILIGIIILLGFSIPLTLNRSSILMEVLVLITWVLASKRFAKKIKKIFVLFLLIISISYIAYKINYKAIEFRFKLTKKSYEEGNLKRFTAGRYYIWKVAFNLFLENPIGGIGLGSFPYRYSLRTGDYTKAVHNAYLKYLTETGIFGFAMFFYIIFYIGLIALKNKNLRHISLSIWIAFSFIIATHELLRAKDFWFGSAIILAIFNLEKLKFIKGDYK